MPTSCRLAVSGLIFAIIALLALRFTLPGLDPVGADTPGTVADPPAGPVIATRGRTAFLLLALVVIAPSGVLSGRRAPVGAPASPQTIGSGG